MARLLIRRKVAILTTATLAAVVICAGLLLLHANRSNGRSPQPSPRPADAFGAGSDAYCGELTRMGAKDDVFLDADSPLDAERCFAAAFSACKDAELTVVTQGVDTGNTDDLHVERSGKRCRVVDRESWFVNVGPRKHATTHCTSASYGPNGLSLTGCDDGDWTIGIPANEPHYAVSTASIPPRTGIVGTINLRECPTPTAGDSSLLPCRTDPAFDVPVIVEQSGVQVAVVHCGADGRYRLPLPPGDYVLRVTSTNGAGSASPKAIAVTMGTVTTADITLTSR